MFDHDYFEDILHRFWKQVEKTDGCWNWKGVSEGKRGRISIGDREMYAYRASWIIHRGRIPVKKFVLHRCDNPNCVRPSHLFLGTQLDNMRDCSAKGRAIGNQGQVRGTKHPIHKLDEDKVRIIRNSNKSGKTLSRKYGVSSTLISQIRKGTAWAWLD